MKILYLPLAAMLFSMILSAGETLEQVKARQDYLDEKESLLMQICKVYESYNGFANHSEAFEARKDLLEFKRDHARDHAGKIKFQKELVAEFEKYHRKMENFYKAGEIEILDVYKVKLSLLDAREYLRQLEQQA